MIISYVIGLAYNMVHTRFYGTEYLDAAEALTRVLNLPKLMSSANRKEYRNVDNQGNAQVYTIGMRIYGTNCDSVVGTAPNTYVTRRAVKAWHDARMKMYKRAGISMKSLGYGRSLRPYLDVSHENGTTTEIDSETSHSGTSASGITPHFTGDEWTYSRAVVATPAEEAGSATRIDVRDLTDTYTFTLCDASVNEVHSSQSGTDSSGDVSDQDSFKSVGMLKEWLGSFKKKVQAGASAVQNVDSDNALLQLISQQGADKEEVLELVYENQSEVRPWDLGGSTHYSESAQAFARSVSGESSYVIFQAPCGLFNIHFVNNHGSAEGVKYDLEVLDISDM